MRFTSGAAEGPSLDAEALGKLNVGSNVHGSLLSAVNAEQAAAEWDRVRSRARPRSVGAAPLESRAFSGLLDPDRIEVLVAALAVLGMTFTVECEDPTGAERIFHSGAQSA